MNVIKINFLILLCVVAITKAGAIPFFDYLFEDDSDSSADEDSNFNMFDHFGNVISKFFEGNKPNQRDFQIQVKSCLFRVTPISCDNPTILNINTTPGQVNTTTLTPTPSISNVNLPATPVTTNTTVSTISMPAQVVETTPIIIADNSTPTPTMP